MLKSATMSNPVQPIKVGYELQWTNIHYAVKLKDGEKVILNNVNGLLPAGSVTCILGPSGAGKSSLLNTLAGRVRDDRKSKLSGSLELNKKRIKFSKMKRRTAYVMQEDALFGTLTPRECLRFSAALRLPSTVTPAQRESLVKDMILDLGLTTCADTLVGNALIKGISGGEKKRTSVGVELVTGPQLVFLDEPTSGLDSFSAYQCVDLLRRVASKGSSVLCTIHQPSSEVFAMFDYCILMKDGVVIYHGGVNEIGEHFTKCGYALPENYNPADHIMAVVQTNTLDQLKTNKAIRELAGSDASQQLNREVTDNADLEDIDVTKLAYPRSFWTQLSWLAWREAINIKRDIGALIGRFGITAFMALLFGIIFHGAGNRDDTQGQNFGSHFGIITMMSINAQFGSAQSTLISFPLQRPIFLREYATGTYRSSAYFVCQATTEIILSFFQVLELVLVIYFLAGLNGNFILLVIILWFFGLASSGVALAIGSAADNPTLAVEASPAVFVPQILFAGFFIRLEQIPAFLRWVQYICGLKYAVNLMILVEFSSCIDDKGTPCGSLLSENDIQKEHWWVYGLILLGLVFGLRFLSLMVLRNRAKRL
eukprot:c20562_g1_i1.p1 GENE.c20562_g1_i1~~c20562_g1_i1.p1  ORF type:complete len:617 (+),score=147.92 c20562_g1_i1:63-1853(+)